ncbi:putative enzyme related to lactoylglutathione lyase [Stackebrandtia albiflava]|uniref:Putative enzyme related to lactoylglutathione lyase n=2 Tax=Stackebrandtia albiflava TaxID=406432 RepID=A0A562UR45_9ACTN|nr:putative enzyme related to lactoylglutathione lyase [Stackebrandtia albiflava]
MGVKKIVVPVADQRRAVDFWTGKLGFTLTVDAPYADTGRRWIEVTSPDGHTAIVLDPEVVGAERPEGLPTQPFFFYADDIEATYRDLSAVGVVFPQPPRRMEWGWWCLFSDSEGNRFALQER